MTQRPYAGGRPGRIRVLLPALPAVVWAFAVAGQEAAVDTGAAEGSQAVEATAKDGPGAAAADWTGVAVLKERIEGEIAELEALAAAQEELLEWNRSRAEIGLEPAALDPGVCLGEALEGWCPLLPATFGAVPADGASGRADDGR